MGLVDFVDLKLESFTLSELKQLAADYQTHASNAIGKSGDSTLSMFPSHLAKRDLTPTDATVLAMDIGGTNVRLGLYRLMSGKVKLVEGTEIEHNQFRGTELAMDEYSKYVGEYVKKFLERYGQVRPEALGFTFSYPAKIVKNNSHIDASREGHSDDWGKGFIVRGSSVNISERLRNGFVASGIAFEKWVTLNDVVALLLADQEASASVVVGTGYNIGITDTHGNIYNTESAYFRVKQIMKSLSKPARLYLEDLRLKLERLNLSEEESVDLKKFSEIQIAGGYLYKLLLYAMAIVGEGDMNMFRAFRKIEGELISMILKGDYDTIEERGGIQLSQMQREYLTKIAEQLIDRATDLVAAELAGAVKFGGSEHELIVAADGSVINFVPGFQEMLVQKMSRILNGTTIRIKAVKDSGLRGAAVAGFVQLQS
ncbi:MAG: hypothetical protein ACE5DX_02865 [Candidatus Dojkabacteria bacterium]